MRFAILVMAALSIPACRAADEAPVVEGTVRAPDGLTLSYDSRGLGDTALVFVHCWACDRSFWRGQLDAFADAYQVVSLDLGGHGASGKDRDEWSVVDLGGDVQAVVEHLDLDNVLLVGHSLGGPVALDAARRMPDRVVGVACVETLHNVEREADSIANEQVLSAMEANYDATMRAFGQAAFAPGADSAVVRWVIEKAVSAHRPAVLGLARDASTLDLRAMLSDAAVPVRCINAAPSPPAIPPTEVEINRQYGDFDAVTMGGVGHFLILEQPEEFNRRLRELLAGLGSD